MDLVGHSLVDAEKTRSAVGQVVPDGCCRPDEHTGHAASVYSQVYMNVDEDVDSGKHPIVDVHWGSDDNSGLDDKSDEGAGSHVYQ